jgi:L-lactate dehydrogenase complex protein LldG
VDDARSVILGRVRAALRDVEGGVEVPRAYGGRGVADPVELFAERVGEYRATVHRGLGALAEACRGRRLVVPADLPAAWRPDGAELVVDDGLDVPALDAIDGALTGCALAIAETGTIVLDGGPGQGRRALSLVPDHHVVVVLAEQVVATVPQAVNRLDPRRPQTWISGPSATSDIELQRVEGVHGPRRLDVVVVTAG